MSCNPEPQVKRLIKALESARGNGTSMISLILPPKDQASTHACYMCVVAQQEQEQQQQQQL
jgi:peptide subunit release factor 1 (eRF1)